MTHLHNVFLEDPIETQLTHGVDGLPLLSFLSSHQQIGDFCGREWRCLSRGTKAQDSSQPMSAESRDLLNIYLCICWFSHSTNIIKYFIPALQDLTD